MEAQGTRPCHPDRDCSQDRSPCAASGATVPFCSGKPGRTPEKARQGGQKKPFRNAPQVSRPQTACKTTEQKHTCATSDLAHRYRQREEDVMSLNPDPAEDRAPPEAAASTPTPCSGEPQLPPGLGSKNTLRVSAEAGTLIQTGQLPGQEGTFAECPPSRMAPGASSSSSEESHEPRSPSEIEASRARALRARATHPTRHVAIGQATRCPI